jgi:hypothetical protein
MINQIFKNPTQQILVLFDKSNFIFNCMFQVLCCVGASSVYSFFQISAQKEVWYHDGWQTCWPWDVSKTWNNVMEETVDHIHAAVWLSCKIRPTLLVRMPQLHECYRAEQCGLCWNGSLALRTFQYAQFLEHHEDRPLPCQCLQTYISIAKSCCMKELHHA